MPQQQQPVFKIQPQQAAGQGPFSEALRPQFNPPQTPPSGLEGISGKVGYYLTQMLSGASTERAHEFQQAEASRERNINTINGLMQHVQEGPYRSSFKDQALRQLVGMQVEQARDLHEPVTKGGKKHALSAVFDSIVGPRPAKLPPLNEQLGGFMQTLAQPENVFHKDQELQTAQAAVGRARMENPKGYYEDIIKHPDVQKAMNTWADEGVNVLQHPAVSGLLESVPHRFPIGTPDRMRQDAFMQYQDMVDAQNGAKSMPSAQPATVVPSDAPVATTEPPPAAQPQPAAQQGPLAGNVFMQPLTEQAQPAAPVAQSEAVPPTAAPVAATPKLDAVHASQSANQGQPQMSGLARSLLFPQSEEKSDSAYYSPSTGETFAGVKVAEGNSVTNQSRSIGIRNVNTGKIVPDAYPATPHPTERRPRPEEAAAALKSANAMVDGSGLSPNEAATAKAIFGGMVTLNPEKAWTQLNVHLERVNKTKLAAQEWRQRVMEHNDTMSLRTEENLRREASSNPQIKVSDNIIRAANSAETAYANIDHMENKGVADQLMISALAHIANPTTGKVLATQLKDLSHVVSPTAQKFLLAPDTLLTGDQMNPEAREQVMAEIRAQANTARRAVRDSLVPIQAAAKAHKIPENLLYNPDLLKENATATPPRASNGAGKSGGNPFSPAGRPKL